MNCFPRYFPMVFAFAGDSTMTRFFAIVVRDNLPDKLPVDKDGCFPRYNPSL